MRRPRPKPSRFSPAAAAHRAPASLRERRAVTRGGRGRKCPGTPLSGRPGVRVRRGPPRPAAPVRRRRSLASWHGPSDGISARRRGCRPGPSGRRPHSHRRRHFSFAAPVARGRLARVPPHPSVRSWRCVGRTSLRDSDCPRLPTAGRATVTVTVDPTVTVTSTTVLAPVRSVATARFFPWYPSTAAVASTVTAPSADSDRDSVKLESAMTAYSAFDWLQRLRSFRRFHVVISHRHLPRPASHAPAPSSGHSRVRPAADGRAGP